MNQKGFTLVELLVIITLLAVTAGVTADIVLTLVRSYNKTRVTNEVEQVGNFAITKIEKELRSATSVVSPSIGASSNSICFLTKIGNNDRSVQYVVDPVSGLLRRSEFTNSSGCTGGTVPAGTDPVFSVGQGGVRISGASANSAFTRLSTSPDVVKIKFEFTQSSEDSAGGRAFTGNVILEQTVVVRGTYN